VWIKKKKRKKKYKLIMCEFGKKMRKLWGFLRKRIFLIFENESLEKEWSDYSLISNRGYLKFIFIIMFCIESYQFLESLVKLK
jgi:hypothetical protein